MTLDEAIVKDMYRAWWNGITSQGDPIRSDAHQAPDRRANAKADVATLKGQGLRAFVEHNDAESYSRVFVEETHDDQSPGTHRSHELHK